MKILRITVNNIASLSGTHTVDFTRDPLRSAGLFSISGATGAGKSTLLDALCLALYDATPRLKQVGRLAELATGEKQNDPRNLLRRGAGEGFAEVAFLGVDGQPWTSRWRVRRSRRSADGALQNVEMTLYRGHITAGGEGPVADGGKKTLVLKSIEDKIGLTFEQFTRAVLLAQNDFATFLKADDKERAEILQALTGTAHFESISRSVFLRCAAEKQTLELLQARLEGNAPLSPEERQNAEASCVQAEQQLTLAESRLSALKAVVDWFQQRTLLQAEKTKADMTLAEAREAKTAAEPRRVELQLTEEVTRHAGPLRTAEQQAQSDLAAALLVQSQLFVAREESVKQLEAAVGKLAVTEESRRRVQNEVENSKPQLQTARELDTRIQLLHQSSARANTALEAARESHRVVAEKLASQVAERTTNLQAQQSLEVDRKRLIVFAPFVGESAKWLDRIDHSITATREMRESRESQTKLAAELADANERLNVLKASEAEHESIYRAATTALQTAVEVEKQYDGDQLAEERVRQEETQRVLTRLHQQLREARTLRERTSAAILEMDRLSTEQLTDQTFLNRLRQEDFPQAERLLEIQKAALELLQAAVSDHAKKLRLALQDEKECPVCGATHHPYSEEEPDFEVDAVKLAKKALKDLEKKVKDIEHQMARLEAALESRMPLIQAQQAEQENVRLLLEQIAYESTDHPAVAAILLEAEEGQMVIAEDQLLAIREVLRKIAIREQKLRDAQKQTQVCRETMERSRETLQQLKQAMHELSSLQSVLGEKSENAAVAVQKAEQRSAECDTALSELWAGLPSGREKFSEDAAAFRQKFAEATLTCGTIDRQLAEIAARLQSVEAGISPLEESVAAAQAALQGCTDELESITQQREEMLERRAEVYSGRSVEVVEAELGAQWAAVTKEFEDATQLRIEADKNLALAGSSLETAGQAVADLQLKVSGALAAVADWLAEFNHRSAKRLSVEELDTILLRDDAWVRNERTVLETLDHAVKSAEGAGKVRDEQLLQHESVCPTTDEQEAVLAALETQRIEQAVLKSTAESARAVIMSDDERRGANQNLMQQIQTQDAKADPWRKLNELLGSSDGAKFRMIAQRRTLDLLLRYANHQLNNLAVRYRLERLPESLNLIVIDRDMGDERRSIHSLSGGESFLVSLALALGLASLTSNRLRIESLFIDEGFGSLDPETLNTAMSALMHLEAQGRKVGVISHVTEMTDAIPVQIKVVKGRGGASRIIVPGDQGATESVVSIPDTTDSAEVVRNDAPEALGQRIVELLQREMRAGKDRVSSKSLRDELNCDLKKFKAAQAWLGDRVFVDGRSLKLVVVDPAD